MKEDAVRTGSAGTTSTVNSWSPGNLSTARLHVITQALFGELCGHDHLRSPKASQRFFTIEPPPAPRSDRIL
jgi:hypothetical protein